MDVNCPACKRAHGDLAPGDYECECKARFRVESKANPKKNPGKKNPYGFYEVRYAMSKSGPISVASYGSLEDARRFLADLQENGWNGIITKDGKPVKGNPKKNPDMSLDKAMRAARAWASKSGNRAALAHIDGYISGAYEFEAKQMGWSEIEAAMPYVLANIGGWRGDEAREAKKVMKQALADAKKSSGRRNPHKNHAGMNPNGDWDNEEDYNDEESPHVCIKCGTHYPCTMEDGACEHHNDICPECRYQSIYRQVEREMDSEDYQGPNPVKSGRGRYIDQAWMLYPSGMPIPSGWEKVGKKHTQGKRPAQPRPGMIWIIRKKETGTRGLPRAKKKRNPRSLDGRRFFLANQAYTLIRKDGYNWELVPQVGMGARYKKPRKLHGTSQEIIDTLYKRGYREGNPSPNPHTPMHLAPKPQMESSGMEGLGNVPPDLAKAIGASAGWAVASQMMERISKVGEALDRAPAGATEVEKAQVQGHLDGLTMAVEIVDGTLLGGGIARGIEEGKASGQMSMEQLGQSVEQHVEQSLGGGAPAPMTEDPGTRRELGFALPKARRSKSKKASSRPSSEGRQSIGFQLDNPVKLPKTYKGPAGGHGQAYAYLDALHKEYQEKWDEDLKATARKKRLGKKLLDWLKPHMPQASHVHLPKFIAHWIGDSPGAGYERATWQRAFERGAVPA